MQLHEKHRPKSLQDISGNAHAVATLQALLDNPQWNGDALWIEGESGTGKTTLANIVAAARCEPMDIQHIPGTDCTVETVDEIRYATKLSSWGKTGWKSWIIDEADAMSPRAVKAWKTILEPLHPRRLYIFTSARPIDTLFETGAENAQLASRCKVLRLERDNEALTARLIAVAKMENRLLTRAEYADIVAKSGGNYRAALQLLETRNTCFAPPPKAADFAGLRALLAS